MSSSQPIAKRVHAVDQSNQDVVLYIALPSAEKTDSKKYHLIVDHFVPNACYKFPKAANGRKFQYKWLGKYPWLRYSQQADGGFCLPCVLFARISSLRCDPDLLVKTPLTDFKRALEKLDQHADRHYHKQSVVAMDEFVKVLSGEQQDIQSQLDDMSTAEVTENRKKMRSIVETIILCGRQNIPLRGHRDNMLDLERDETANKGNFWALLHFRVAAGDTVLGDHLERSAKNAIYTSPDIQNQIIEILGHNVRHKILSKVHKAQFFTIIADEVTDCSNKEQLGIVLRYVDQDSSQIHEDLVTFIECDSGVCGSDLAGYMLGFLRAEGVDLTKMRGQAYDGAGSMSGKTNGAAALITAEYPLALYLHCASHCLNLVVVKSLDETNVRNMMGIAFKVWLFFSAHPKRQNKLEEAIGETQPESKVKKLKDLCRTRWIQRIDAIDRFQTLHPSIVHCLKSISAEGSHRWSHDSLIDSKTLLLAITTTEFLSALVIVNACLHLLHGLTCSLQAEAKDIVGAVSEISCVRATLKKIREDVSSRHKEWFTTVEQMCHSVGDEPSLPRLCARQAHRSNIPAENACEYYRRVISIPLLDHLISQIESRFTSHHQTALHGLYLVPALLVQKPVEEMLPKIELLGDMYEDDIPSINSLPSEFQCWYLKWKQQEQEHGLVSLPNTLSFTLSQPLYLFPNIRVLLLILCTLPVTSCSVERSFSGLKRIKKPSQIYHGERSLVLPGSTSCTQRHRRIS